MLLKENGTGFMAMMQVTKPAAFKLLWLAQADISVLLPGVEKWGESGEITAVPTHSWTAWELLKQNSINKLLKERVTPPTHITKASAGNRAGILTEATDRGDVVCGQCDKGRVEWLILLLVVQDLWLTERKTSPTVSPHRVPHIPLPSCLIPPFWQPSWQKVKEMAIQSHI